MNVHESDARWMRRCEVLARQAGLAGNTPAGAVVVLVGATVGEAAGGRSAYNGLRIQATSIEEPRLSKVLR